VFVRVGLPRRSLQSEDRSVANSMELNEITYKINGAIFEVNRTLGTGFMESVYEKALMVELKSAGLKAKNQVPIKVRYKGEIVGDFLADIIVEDAIILELKVVEKLQKIHEAQLMNYLKATEMKIGLLVNFTHPKAVIKRFVM
jgi:GxxExxY protein